MAEADGEKQVMTIGVRLGAPKPVAVARTRPGGRPGGPGTKPTPGAALAAVTAQQKKKPQKPGESGLVGLARVWAQATCSLGQVHGLAHASCAQVYAIRTSPARVFANTVSSFYLFFWVGGGAFVSRVFCFWLCVCFFFGGDGGACRLQREPECRRAETWNGCDEISQRSRVHGQLEIQQAQRQGAPSALPSSPCASCEA